MALRSLKRKLFTRCAGCGGWSSKRNPVNNDPTGGNRPTGSQKLWDSEVGLYHSDCALASRRAARRLDAQHRAEPHWYLHTYTSHLADMIDEGKVDKDDVAGKLREASEHSVAEFRKIINEGEK